MYEQIEFFIIPNPCKNYCEADKNGYCLQCYRSRKERFHWHQLLETEKRDVIRLCRQRRRRKQTLSLKQDKTHGSDTGETEKQLPLF